LFSLFIECKDLLSKILVVDPKERISMNEILSHPWVKDTDDWEDTLKEEESESSNDISDDDAIINQMEKIGFQREKVLDSLQEDSYDSICGTFKLLQKQNSEANGKFTVHRANSAGGRRPRAGSFDLKREVSKKRRSSYDHITPESTNTPTAGRRRVRTRRQSLLRKEASRLSPAPKQEKPTLRRFSSEVLSKDNLTEEAPKPIFSDAKRNEDHAVLTRYLNSGKRVSIAQLPSRRPGVDGNISAELSKLLDNRVEEQNEQTTGPRPMRLPFSQISTKQPSEIIEQILQHFEKERISYEPIDNFTLKALEPKVKVRFEIEICTVPNLPKLHCVRTKRVEGEWCDYKQICNNLKENLKL